MKIMEDGTPYPYGLGPTDDGSKLLKQKTAVEWLWGIIGNIKTNPKDALLISQSFNQAKQMEKDQIMMAYKWDNYPCSDEDAEQYYNETYGK